VRLPSNLDKAEMAPLLCAGVTVFNGIRKMNIEQGGIVAVEGLGGLGHLAVQYSRKMGYRTVALSSSDAKHKFATDLGATDYVDGSKEKTVDALQAMGGADLIVVTAPNPQVRRRVVLEAELTDTEMITDLPWALAPMGKVLVLARQYPLLPLATN
jgi:D-arabinose 1-dehydrogenase-like Zn-dependent alcohol dehydrogenase